MASILIVEDDGLVARHLARTLRQAGHLPILAPDAESALQEALDCPDVVLLDLGLPDLPGEEVLARLKRQPETAHIPVVVITGRREAAAQLQALGATTVTDILLKPVSGAQLQQAVETALGGRREFDPDALQVAKQRQRELILRLVTEGPDPLAFHVSRRVCADRVPRKGPTSASAMTWAEIADWGRREGLLTAEEASLLRHVPLAGQKTPTGSA